ncbi:Exocyst complex component SEC3A [Camellia lanceoleosa]|nr:Exocyst complex component SEC3A [Camellia lanceoleosa]
MELAREFANELLASTKASRNPTMCLKLPQELAKLQTMQTLLQFQRRTPKCLLFIPLLVDESSFFAYFMCFEVLALIPPGDVTSGNKTGLNDDDTNDDDDLGILDIDENDCKIGNSFLNCV